MAIMLLLGLPQMAFTHDKSYLSVSLVGMYLIAEVMAGKQAIWISRQHRNLQDTADWLRKNKIESIQTNDGIVVIISKSSDCTIAAGPFADLIKGLVDKNANGSNGKIDQKELIDSFVEHLERRTSIGEFIAGRIVWVGILATIIGVIMAFWPFQQAGMTIDTMRSNLGAFFSGVAVAFIPTAVSFVFKIMLDFNSKIIHDGVSEMIEIATGITSSHIVPRLESGSVKI